jgi:arylsulfatase A-like enzyme
MMHRDEKTTLADLYAGNRYPTAMVGIWHLRHKAPTGRKAVGFGRSCGTAEATSARLSTTGEIDDFNDTHNH